MAGARKSERTRCGFIWKAVCMDQFYATNHQLEWGEIAYTQEVNDYGPREGCCHYQNATKVQQPSAVIGGNVLQQFEIPTKGLGQSTTSIGFDTTVPNLSDQGSKRDGNGRVPIELVHRSHQQCVFLRLGALAVDNKLMNSFIDEQYCQWCRSYSLI